MKKKHYFTVFMLAGLTVAGCAKTPEKAVVREKSEHGIEDYQEDTGSIVISSEMAETSAGEADGAGVYRNAGTEANTGTDANTDTEADAGTEADTGDAQAMVGLGTIDGAQAVNALAKKLQVPETYKASFVSDDGNFTLTCDADIFVPDVEKVPVYQVTQKEFSQEMIDQVTNAFFGDAPVYDADYLFTLTKAQVEEKLNELKGYQAEGNLDPYGYIADAREAGEEDAESYYDLQADIDNWEAIYAEAPETREKVEIQPGFADGEHLSGGYVEMENGNYYYKLKKSSYSPIEFSITQIDKEDRNLNNGDISYYEAEKILEVDKMDPSLTEEEQWARMEEQTGITQDEAVAMADEYLERMGLLDEFSAKNVLLSRGRWLDYGTDDEQIIGYGWQVNYTRDIDGFPVTDEEEQGGGVESMESTIEPWCYEHIQLTVNKEGLLNAEIYNLYEVGARRMENIKLLPFSEIASIFEQMLQIQNADMSYAREKKFNISHVTLGYMRVYDPTVDNRTGTMIPVWDFFGSDERIYEGETEPYKIERATNSYLTINAADGTVISRSLGY